MKQRGIRDIKRTTQIIRWAKATQGRYDGHEGQITLNCIVN